LGKATKKLHTEIEGQEDFISELPDDEDKLRRAANLQLKPDLNDGVVLNISPLHELVPQRGDSLRIFHCCLIIMSKSTPTVYVIAGPNGAGKTTFATEFLPDFVDCREFLNADLIAAGLAPFAPETQDVRAGRLLLERIQELPANVKILDSRQLYPVAPMPDCSGSCGPLATGLCCSSCGFRMRTWLCHGSQIAFGRVVIMSRN
jgi:hypothetical protein